MIFNLTKEDLTDVVNIHKNNLPSLINFYTNDFIEKFYLHHLRKEDDTVLVGYKEGGELYGFVFGTLDVEDMFGSFTSQNKTYFIKQTLLALIKHPKYLLYIFQSFFAKGFQQGDSKIQLVYIAVDQKRKGLGIGKKLLEGFEQELKKTKDYYELEVEQNNSALQFYTSKNFKIIREINNILEKKYLIGKKLK